MVDLFQNFLQVLRADPVHVGVKLLLLLLGQQRALVSILTGVASLLTLPIDALDLIRNCLLIRVLRLCHLRDFLLAFPLEVLVNSVLHRVNSFLQPRVPIVFHSVVCATHELLGDEAPLLGALVAQDEEHPLLLL